MKTAAAREIAQAVLYEGYLLWPYRRSARKNQQRWTFGGVFPEAYCVARANGDAALTQTECLIEPGATARLDVQVRFLHAVTRTVERSGGDDRTPVPELTVDDRRYLGGDETVERELEVTGVTVGYLPSTAQRFPIEIPTGRHIEWLADSAGRRVGAVVRAWAELRGWVEILTERVSAAYVQVTVRIRNTTPWSGSSRSEAARRAFLSAHTVLHSGTGTFVSLTDPPAEARPLAAGCRNIGAWPVLVGEEGERHTMLSAPIILSDYPRIAPESPGDLFDATEIDQLLTLSILSLTEEEQREIRDGDPRARELLDRCAALTPEQLARLGGTLRPVGELR